MSLPKTPKPATCWRDVDLPHIETQIKNHRYSQPRSVCSVTSGSLNTPQGAVPRCTNTGTAEPARRQQGLCTLCYCPPSHPVDAITSQYPGAFTSFSTFKVLKHSLQHHKQFAGCFGLRASSRKDNSRLLQPMAALHCFSLCLGCPKSKAGTSAPSDVLEKACFYPYPIVSKWIATVCEPISRLSWVILNDSHCFSF